MKARKWPSLIIAAFTILSLGSCEDWGQMDPPAGSDVYPKLEQVLNLKFDGDRVNSEEIQTFAYSGGDVPSLVTDEKMGQVLCLDNGYARIFNPYNKVKVQNAVSLVFYVKQAGTAEMTDEDEIAAYTQDLTGALFSFENQNGTQRMFITANGWLSYEGEDGRYEANNPNSANTGLLTPDVWHYVALSVTNTGYFVYVDGKKRIEQNVTDFDFSKIVQFMASVPYIYMGYGSDTQTKKFYLDDVKFYRNTITSKEWTDPRKPDGGEDDSFTYPIATKTAIGSADCNSAWWTEFSDYYTLQPNTTLHLVFTNHTSGVNNWNNWNLCVSTEDERGGSDYVEHFIIRSDLYGWGDDNFSLENFGNEGYGDWDKFRADMEGANVVIDISRSGSKVQVTATATCKDGTVYKETYWQECGDGTQRINAFLIVDSSYLEMDTKNTRYMDPVTINQNSVGTPDCSTAWWTSFSEYFTIQPNTTFEISFTNHTSGVNNWNNWNLCVSTEDERGGSDYVEHFIIRSDLYGWGDDNFSLENFGNEGYGDWDKFRADMEGANVTINISRSDAKVEVIATAVCPDGTIYKETYWQECGDGDQNVNAFLIVDSSYLELKTANKITNAFQ